MKKSIRFFQTKIKKIKRKTKGKTAAPGFVTFADKKKTNER